MEAKNILEIGTAIGYSAFCFANGNDVDVTTIDMESTHQGLAQENWLRNRVEDRITFLLGKSDEVLPTLSEKYDIVFFDGFAPNPEEVKEYVRLISTGGVIISTNLSWNKTTPEYLAALDSYGLHSLSDDDIAFSSIDAEVVAQCLQLWHSMSSQNMRN